MELQAAPASPQPNRENRFDAALRRSGLPVLERAPTTVLQINVGKLCNQTCNHCHVEAGPKRTEVMAGAVVERLIELAGASQVRTVDLTGGAPEMNPHFRRLVEGMAALGKEVLSRCNLTILLEPGYEWLAEFYAAHRVHLVCSLPCYTEDNVTRQRGRGVFDKSIAALQRLNALGYGDEDADGLPLDLVYNPLGASLPGSQANLEADYKRELGRRFGVRFSRLLTLANLPIGRFARTLQKRGELEPYLRLLEESFNPGTVPQLMCRNTLNVGWDGQLYDCDFNLAAGLPFSSTPIHVRDADRLEAGIPVMTDNYCFACTAGSGFT